jgi:hypothetical protein
MLRLTKESTRSLPTARSLQRYLGARERAVESELPSALYLYLSLERGVPTKDGC